MSNLIPERRRGNTHTEFYDPFKHFDELFDGVFGPKEIELFQNMKTDIRESKDEYILETELPGFDKDDINIDIRDNILIINAKRETSSETKDKKGNCIHCERSSGSFSRSFDVTDVDIDSINAKYENGILEIRLPKKDEAKKIKTKIEIK